MNYKLTLWSLWALSLAIPCWAQDENSQQTSYGIFQSRNEYDEFMGNVKRSAAESPELQSMIGMINDVVLNRPLGATDQQYGSAAHRLGLLVDRNVRGDVEMVDDQYQKLQDLNADLQKRMAEQMRNFDFSDSNGVVNQLRKMRDEADSELNALLLPHQMARLRQIQSRNEMRRRGLIDLLTTEPIRSELEISEDQAKDLRDAEREIAARLQRQIEKLREEARDELLSKLSREQREQVERIFGKPIEFERPPKETAPAKAFK